MLKLGHEKDLQQHIENYIRNTCGSIVLNNICKLLIFLDEYYGESRDIYNNDGGYVVIIEDKDEWEIYNNETNGLLKRNNYESFFYFNSSFVRVDFMINNETMVNVYMPRELFNE